MANSTPPLRTAFFSLILGVGLNGDARAQEFRIPGPILMMIMDPGAVAAKESGRPLLTQLANWAAPATVAKRVCEGVADRIRQSLTAEAISSEVNCVGVRFVRDWWWVYPDTTRYGVLETKAGDSNYVVKVVVKDPIGVAKRKKGSVKVSIANAVGVDIEGRVNEEVFETIFETMKKKKVDVLMTIDYTAVRYEPGL